MLQTNLTIMIHKAETNRKNHPHSLAQYRLVRHGDSNFKWPNSGEAYNTTSRLETTNLMLRTLNKFNRNLDQEMTLAIELMQWI